MIDPLSEQVISLADGARFCPARRKGRKPHISCMYRWTKTGCKGVVLESLQVGGTRCTSKEALARFFSALTHVDVPRPDHTPNRRQRAAAAAERELEREGL